MGTFLHKVLLYNLYKIDCERSVYSIFHLLNGKKSSQTIQDAHLFQLTPFFNTYDQVTRIELDQLTNELIQDGLLTKNGENHYKITDVGINEIAHLFQQYPFLGHLNGWRYQSSKLFWERLSLFTQVASNLKSKETKYFPVQKDKQVQNWMKRLLTTTHINRKDLSHILFDELVHCFEAVKCFNPSVLVVRLTGFNALGRTKEQACDVLDMEYSYYHYQFLSLLHYMQHYIRVNKSKLIILPLMLENLEEETPLTFSTRKTYELLKRGYSLEQIAFMRNLKKNTIEDHIVELALNIERFDISPYVNQNKQDAILKAAKKVPSKQLRFIREYVSEADYFEIRLVIAKSGEKQ